LVAAEQELLSRLPASIEGARNLCAAEGTVCQKAAVFTREWNSLRHTLIDDVQADFRQPVHIRLTSAEVATLDGVVEKTENTVSVVLVVLCCVYSSLRGNRVGTARRVLKAQAGHLVSQLRERRGCGTAGQAGTDHDHVGFPLVGRVHKLHVEAMLVPALLQRTGRNACV